MSLAISCESCGQKLTAGEKLYGKKVKCPKCGTALAIPTPAASAAVSDIGDLLDDEPAPAPEPSAETATKKSGPKCKQCGDELPEGTRYCVVCGYNNIDMDATVGQTALDYGKRQQKIAAQGQPRHWLWNALLFWH